MFVYFFSWKSWCVGNLYECKCVCWPWTSINSAAHFHESSLIKVDDGDITTASHTHAINSLQKLTLSAFHCVTEAANSAGFALFIFLHAQVTGRPRERRARFTYKQRTGGDTHLMSKVWIGVVSLINFFPCLFTPPFHCSTSFAVIASSCDPKTANYVCIISLDRLSLLSATGRWMEKRLLCARGRAFATANLRPRRSGVSFGKLLRASTKKWIKTSPLHKQSHKIASSGEVFMQRACVSGQEQFTRRAVVLKSAIPREWPGIACLLPLSISRAQTYVCERKSRKRETGMQAGRGKKDVGERKIAHKEFCR